MKAAVLRSRKVRVGLGIIVLFTLAAIFGPWFNGTVVGYNAKALNYLAIGQGPGAHHLLGTTSTGQDVLAQLIAGSRNSLLVGVVAAVVGTTLSILFGVTAGFFGKGVDTVLNFITNLFIIMPVFPLTLVVAGYLQGTGPLTIALIIGVFGWAGGARSLRAQTMSLRNRDFTMAMRMLGENRIRLIFVEVFPQLSGWVSAMFLHGIIGGVLAEAGLAFLGISNPDTVSWGTMIENAQQQNAILNGQWWWFIPPGICIAAIGTATGLINFGVDEIANPKLRSARRPVVKRARKTARARAEAAA
ncbi:MAG TPA: ABC transporter permease [Mycobacteriales bacterium]|jgi:peptide/nickel transport system permease protein|nr:ABC transporter permease [Mycobacteriales bacterium]